MTHTISPQERMMLFVMAAMRPYAVFTVAALNIEHIQMKLGTCSGAWPI